MNRYGDSPEGMVEAALEFIAIAEDVGFQRLIVSMKSSNPKVMVHAYRLLVAALDQRGTPYPYISVTEAGDGEDGRVKGCRHWCPARRWHWRYRSCQPHRSP